MYYHLKTKGDYTNVVFVHGFAIFILGGLLGPASGGHFNPAISLAVFFRQIGNIFIFGEYNGGRFTEFFSELIVHWLSRRAMGWLLEFLVTLSEYNY